MNKFKSLVLAAAVSLVCSSAAFAVIPGSATDGAASAYEQNHQGALAMLTGFKNELTSAPEVSAPLKQLPTELAKLPGLAKAYLDAEKAGNQSSANAALDAYTQEAQTIIDLAIPLDTGLMPMRAQIEQNFAAMGPDGVKLAAEKDIAAAMVDINAALKPLDDANAAVGPLESAAAKSASLRMKVEAKKIFGEELRVQAGNMLQGKVAQ
jgi:hypothetical protein